MVLSLTREPMSPAHPTKNKTSEKSGIEKPFGIVIVAYYAEKTIRDLLQRIPVEIRNTAKEIILLDDASTDGTTHVAEEVKKELGLKNLTIIHNEKNLGYGGNQKKGYQLAMQNGCEYMVMLHGDAQYGPEEIPALLQLLRTDAYGMVFGSRMSGRPLEGGMPLWKFMGNKFLTVYANFMLGERLTEYHSGFRGYSAAALKKVDWSHCSDGFVFDTDIVLELKRLHEKFAEVTIPTHYGPESRQIQVIPVFKYGLQIMKRTTRYALGPKTREPAGLNQKS